jgi:endonuclease/exonuclease/phosphatase family metal-dependent hydrolase
VSLKVLSYNIRFGGLPRIKALAEVILSVKPDLVIFQEATDPTVIERLAQQTEMPFWAARQNHSIAFISRKEVSYHEWHYPAGAKHSFLEIVPRGGGELRIFGLHLSARFSKWDERKRTREIRSLLQGISRHQEGFHVLVGDFNTLAPGEVLELRKLPAWIRALIWVSGRQLQRDTIQLMLDAAYLDVYRTLHAEDKGYTFPTWDPHVRLDYVFVPKQFLERIVSCEVIREPAALIPTASDHCPLSVELELSYETGQT